MDTAAALKFNVKMKTLRDTNLAVVNSDLGRRAHGNNSGLCNAVDLNKDDHASVRLKSRNHTNFEMKRSSRDSYTDSCCKELVLVQEKN